MMSASSFGSRFVITSFGESHGVALGIVIDGCPAGVAFDMDLLRQELARRRPGRHGKTVSVVSDREEADAPEVLSGVFEGRTLGTPIAILVRNIDSRSGDYAEIASRPRPGHADDMWRGKFGHSDHRGGGRSSGRETVCRVMAGAVARMLMKQLAPTTRVHAFASRIGPVALDASERLSLDTFFASAGQSGASSIDDFSARMPIGAKNAEVERLLQEAKATGKSYGGVVEIRIENPPPFLGQPVFHKLKADLASAFMSIGATAAVELGDGGDVAAAEGSEFHSRDLEISPYGGIRGGISTGERILFRVVFKPTASVLDVAKKGRHDPCIVPRAIPVLEAMTHVVLADHLLWSRTDRVD